MAYKSFSSYKRVRGPSQIQRLIRSTIYKAMRIIDEVLTGKTIQIFEAMLIDIIATQRIYEYDKNASYYGKLLSLIDLEDDIELISNTGTLYRIKDYPHITFSRNELQKIGNQYTKLKAPLLSQECINA